MSPRSSVVDYYVNQAGSGIGHVFIGARHQKGYGIGAFLGGLFRSILPMLSSSAKAVGKEALKMGGRVLADVAHDNQPLAASLKRRAIESGEHLTESLEKKAKTMSGSGYKRSVTKKKPQSRSALRTGRVTKATRRDIFSV